MNYFPRYSIEEDLRSSSEKNILYPGKPFFTKAFSLKQFQYCRVLNFVEGLFKIEFKDYDLFFGVMA
jgi:hypothetical protein